MSAKLVEVNKFGKLSLKIDINGLKRAERERERERWLNLVICKIGLFLKACSKVDRKESRE